jgi:hypothetical protein
MSGFNIVDFGILEDKLIACTNDATGPGWYVAELPEDLIPPLWEKITTPDTNGQLRIIGKMALQVEIDSAFYWVNALLVNSATVLNVNNFAFYVDPVTGDVEVKEWTEFYPSGEKVADAMPRAGTCAMWGDFLVLGDIVWVADDTAAFSSSNATRFRHGLWFSIPGKTDTWTTSDTTMTGQKAGANVIQGVFPLEAGLLVVSCTVVVLLQGTPDDFIYRELREGISNCGRRNVAAWPEKGGVVWANNYGNVWFTNGEDFMRFDEAIEIGKSSSIAAQGQYLFVSNETTVYVFRVFDESGGWTRLVTDFGFNKMVATPNFLIAIEAREPFGSFILDDEENGLLDSDDVLWSADLKINAFDFNAENRGIFDSRKIRSLIRTRPLPGFGHKSRFWHRYGVRAKGSGSLEKAVSRPSADSSVRGYQSRINGKLNRRFDYVFDAHGPSVEATFDFEFSGDVTVEHVTVWEIGGTEEK